MLFDLEVDLHNYDHILIGSAESNAAELKRQWNESRTLKGECLQRLVRSYHQVLDIEHCRLREEDVINVKVMYGAFFNGEAVTSFIKA